MRTSYPYLHLGLLRWDEEPPYADHQADTCTDAQRGGRTNTVDQYTADEASQKQADDSHDLVIARNDISSNIKELRVGHELTPCRGQHNYRKM